MKQQFVKLRYNEYYNAVVDNANPIWTQNFRLNSIYDPLMGNVNKSAEGLAQWGVFYRTYRVYGVKVHIAYIGTGTSVTPPLLLPSTWMGLYAGADYRKATTKWDMISWTRQPAQGKVMVQKFNIDPTQKSNRALKTYYTMKNLLAGIPVGESDLQADTNADPVRQVFLSWIVSKGEIFSPSSGSVILTFNVKLTYYVKFWNPIAYTAGDTQDVPDVTPMEFLQLQMIPPSAPEPGGIPLEEVETDPPWVDGPLGYPDTNPKVESTSMPSSMSEEQRIIHEGDKSVFV